MRSFRAVVGLLIVAGGLGLAGLVLAQGAGYEIIHYRLGTGGQAAGQGGPFGLSAAVGDPDVGALSGGTYSLAGGFRVGPVPSVAGPNPVGPSPRHLFLPALSRH